MGEVLIDTNILVYAHQPGEGRKYERAVATIEMLTDARLGRVTAQILGEFVSATTRGRRPLLHLDDATAQVRHLAAALPVLEVTRFIVLEATRGVRYLRRPATAGFRSGRLDVSCWGVSVVSPLCRDGDWFNGLLDRSGGWARV